MSSVATTNRASEMWTNDPVNQSDNKQYGYRQYPNMHPYYNYQNHFYAQNSGYSNTMSADHPGKMYGHNQREAVVKSEPGHWPTYTDYMNDQGNADMVNKWREMNFYSQQQYDNCGYDQRLNQRNGRSDMTHDDARSINSPGQCSIPETSYGSPQSTASNMKTLEQEDSPNLRALLSKPQNSKSPTFFNKNDKSYTHDVVQRMMLNPEEIRGWEKTNEIVKEKESNLPQFHGGYSSKGQTSIKKDAMGGALVEEESASSLQEPTEPCQDVTRVGASANTVDYAENKMAATVEGQTFYPWMKSVNGKYIG